MQGCVQVILPFYESLPTDQIEGLQHERDFQCPKASQAAACAAGLRLALS